MKTKRVKLTTMANEGLLKDVKIYCIENRIHVSDIIDEAFHAILIKQNNMDKQSQSHLQD